MKTDAQLQQDVLAELKWEPSINAAQISVEVKDGVVTLAGHVGSFAEKWDAGRAAQRVSGVNALAVEIEVLLPGPSQRSDAEIARSASAPWPISRRPGARWKRASPTEYGGKL